MRTSASRAWPYVSTAAAVRAAHRPHALVVGVEDGRAGRRQRRDELALGPGDAVEPAERLGVRRGDRGDDADVGAPDGAQPGDLAERRACPSPARAPRCRRARRGSVTGRPCSLLKLRSFAVTRRPAATAARTRSFVDVLPTLPVMPTTVASSRPRAHVASAISAARGVGDLDDRDRRVDRAGGERRRRAACGGRGDEVVAVARGDEGHEQLARAQRAGVERGPVDVDVGARAACRRWLRPRPTPGSSSRRTVPSARASPSDRTSSRGPDPPRRAVRRAVRRARRQLRHGDGRPRRRRPAALPHHADRHLPRRASGRSPPAPRRRWRPGPPALPARLDPTGEAVSPRRRPRRLRPASARSCCRCCTARWARTARCRACSSWPAWRTSGAACSARRWRWTRRWPSRCWRTTASPRPATGRSATTSARPACPNDLAAELGLPCFVKPANMGSSVGVTKARTVEELRDAIDVALTYDEWVVVEEAVVGAGDRGRRARQHRARGVRRRRDRARRRLLRLRGQVRHRRRPAADPRSR